MVRGIILIICAVISMSAISAQAATPEEIADTYAAIVDAAEVKICEIQGACSGVTVINVTFSDRRDDRIMIRYLNVYGYSRGLSLKDDDLDEFEDLVGDIP